MKTPLSSAKHQHQVEYNYGALPTEPINNFVVNVSLDDVNLNDHAVSDQRRWSVLEKLDRRHYCRIRSCRDCCRIINSRCLLATIMLGSCILLAIVFTRTMLLNAAITDMDHYDFIVIGAGPAGSVITNKLVNHGAKVLLLEAGGPTQYSLGGKDYFGGPMSRFDIPLMWAAVTTFQDYHWQGFNLPSLIVAKGLGGGGFNNAMIYVRSLASDIDGWGLKGWNWNTTLSHYLSFEDYGNDENPGDMIPDYHGTGGPVRTTRAPYIDEIAPEFISSAVQYGIKFASDFNAPDGRVGVGYYDFNIKGGLRDSAARAFLAPLINQDPPIPNFNLQSFATARKVLLNPNRMTSTSSSRSYKHHHASNNNNNHHIESYDEDNPTYLHSAIGVEYEQDGIIKTAYLSSNVNIGAIQSKFEYDRGVIITAGAILSPKLLMNSGIGPRHILEEAGIDVMVDNPYVGKNLQDHPAVGVTFRIIPALASSYPNVYSVMSRWDKFVQDIDRANQGEEVTSKEFGVLSSPGISAGAFLCSPYASPGIPDIQLTVFPSVSEPHLIKEEYKNRKRNATSAEVLEQSKQMLITIALMTPEARYEVVLNSTDPMNAVPLIKKPDGKEHYLTDNDIKKLAWGVEQVIAIANTQPLSHLIEEILSPPADLDSYETWVNDNHYPNSHWSGSIRMGMNSKTSVLDEKMRVRGVKGLYVADASTFPVIPNGNVHSTVVMVAAQAADMILRQTMDVTTAD